jgi:hypothetical protein
LVFIHNGPYFLTELRIFRDGMIDCWELVDFDGFREKVSSGWVVTTLPEGAEVSIQHLTSFTARDRRYAITGDDLIGEVRDTIEALNGRPTSSVICGQAFATFNEHPSDETRASLKRAYEAVPRHLRHYLGDMDRKDHPIRRAVYGDAEVLSR